MLKEYLNVEKIIWVKDGIDLDETDGHIDLVASFIRPGEMACIWIAQGFSALRYFNIFLEPRVFCILNRLDMTDILS